MLLFNSIISWILFQATLLLAVVAPTIVAAMSVSSSVGSPKTMMQRVIVYGSRSSASRLTTSDGSATVSSAANTTSTTTTTTSTTTTPPNPTDEHQQDDSASTPLVALHHRPIPTPTKGHVLIKVVCAGLNPVDAKHVMGDKLPPSWTYVQKLYRENVLAGKVIGFDFSGIVETCPCGSFQPGDAVFGTMPPFHGTLAEYVVAPLHQVYYKPKQHSFAQAAALPLVGLTALQSLAPHVRSKSTSTTSPSSSTSSVLIIGGSGGTGHVACQVARNLGAAHVTTICSRRNTEFCQQRGATHVVDYQTSHDELVQALQRAPGCPFDVVLDCVTSADPRDSMDHHYPTILQHPAHGLVRRPKYVYLRLGGATWDWFRAGVRRATYGIGNLFWGAEQLFWVRFPHSAQELQQLVHWADAGLLAPHVHAVDDQGNDRTDLNDNEDDNADPQRSEQIALEFTPQAVQKAFQAILSRRVQGKLVVRVSDLQGDATVRPTTQT